MSTTESCYNAAEPDVQVQKSPDGVLQAVLQTFNESEAEFTWVGDTDQLTANKSLMNAIPQEDQWLFPEHHYKYKATRKSEGEYYVSWVRTGLDEAGLGPMPIKDLPSDLQQKLAKKYKQCCIDNDTPIRELSSVRLTEWNAEIPLGPEYSGGHISVWYLHARNQNVILTLYEGSPTVPSDQTECDGAEVDSTAVSAPGDAVSSDSPGQHSLESIQTEEVSVASNE